MTGFFGAVPGGLLQECGRGYSDLLAAIVAVSIDARELQASPLSALSHNVRLMRSRSGKKSQVFSQRKP